MSELFDECPECYLGASGPKPEAASIVVFGATGDLARRKIFPALYNLAGDALLPEGTRIIGFARRDWSDDRFRSVFRESCLSFSRRLPPSPESGESCLAALEKSISFIQGDLSDPEAYERLASVLGQSGMPANVLFYLAVGPDLFATIADMLWRAGLGTGSAQDARSRGRYDEADPDAVAAERGAVFTNSIVVADAGPPGPGQGERRLIVEKPFGRDRESSRRLSRHLQNRFREKDIFRIDHYLGKETVQNLLYLRFANAIFEPLWNRNHIESIDIDVFETQGIGSRGGYYDTAGAARDMLQNHLVQLLCLIAMEPPSSLDPEAIRDEKVKVLKAIPDYTHEDFASRSIRAQYAASGVPSAKGYREEDKVAPNSMTETFVGLRIELDNWRFSGVPITLRTGKALDRVMSEITVHFKRPPATLFAAHCGERLSANRLTVRIQPDDGVWLSFNGKVPGAPRIRQGNLSFSSSGGDKTVPEAYERLIADALAGDSTLFIRSDESDEAWRIVDALENAWSGGDAIPLESYAAGAEPLAFRDRKRKS
jgi:glucose-6-phosphate 1-dehydrogenase